MAGQVFAVNSQGGYMYADQLSDEFREAVQPMVRFRQFCDIKNAAGENRGNVFRWNIYQNIQNQGGTLVETNTIPESNFLVTQASLTITEYGNSIPYSGKLEALAKQSVRRPLMRALKNDAVKTFDSAAHTQFNNTLLRVVPTAGTSATAVTLTTNGTATLTNNVAYGTGHAKALSDTMKERNIPPYTDDDFFAVAWPTTYRTIKNSLETLHQYTPEGFRLILNGEIGRYENIRHVEQTFIGKGISNNGTAWSNSLSDWIYFFGEDTVAEGIAIAEELRAKIPSDYGRSKGIAWYYLGGFGIVQNDSGNPQNNRILKWDSAA